MKKLTYANVMATIAVFIALGGTSYAISKLPKNSVGPKQLKKNSVTTAKIKDGAVTGPKLTLSTLGAVPEAAHAKSADRANSADRASNADRANSADRASNANSAGHADNADTVGGLSVIKFEGTGLVPLASPVTLVSLGGLRLEYACIQGAPDVVFFRASTSVNGANLFLSRTYSGGTALESKEPFNGGDPFLLTGFVGTGVYAAPGGKVVTFTYRNSLTCATGVAGTVYGG
jgi:hypothetical protein